MSFQSHFPQIQELSGTKGELDCMGLKSQLEPEDTQHLAGSDPSHARHSRARCFATDPSGATISPVTSITEGGRGPGGHSSAWLYLELSQIPGFIILCKL